MKSNDGFGKPRYGALLTQALATVEGKESDLLSAEGLPGKTFRTGLSGLFGELSELALFPDRTPKKAMVLISTNWLDHKSPFLDKLMEQSILWKKAGCEFYILLEMLSPRAYFPRMVRAAALPEYWGVEKADDLRLSEERTYVYNTFQRFKGPGPTQLRHAYTMATRQHLASTLAAGTWMLEADAEGIPAGLQFTEEPDRPLVYCRYEFDDEGLSGPTDLLLPQTLAQDILVEGTWSHGTIDLLNAGYLTTDSRLIGNFEVNRLSKLTSPKTAKALLEEARDPRFQREAEMKINIVLDGVLDPDDPKYSA